MATPFLCAVFFLAIYLTLVVVDVVVLLLLLLLLLLLIVLASHSLILEVKKNRS